MTRLGMVINLDRCIGCYACSVGCAVSRGLPAGERWAKVKEYVSGTFPNLAITNLPTACMQCENAPCLAVCPTGATTKGEDGVIIVDDEVCIGCGMCIQACPYGARTIVKDIISNHGADGPTTHEAKHQAKLKANVARKCEFCSDRRARNEEPLCVKTCVANARTFGDLDDPNSDVAKLARNAKVLLGSEGTNPSVYYLYSGTHNLDTVFKS